MTTTLRRAFLVLTVLALLGSYYVAPYIPADVPLVAEWAGHGHRIVEGVLEVFSALHDLVVVDGGPILARFGEGLALLWEIAASAISHIRQG